MVISIDGVNRQFLLLNALKVIGSVVHLTVKIIIGKGATGDSILTIRLHHKADAVHFAQQGVRVMGQLIFQFIPVERNHLIEVDLLATRQDADLAALLCTLGAGENGGTRFVFSAKFSLLSMVCPKPSQVSLAMGRRAKDFSRRMGQYHFSSFMDS